MTDKPPPTLRPMTQKEREQRIHFRAFMAVLWLTGFFGSAVAMPLDSIQTGIVIGIATLTSYAISRETQLLRYNLTDKRIDHK